MLSFSLNEALQVVLWHVALVGFVVCSVELVLTPGLLIWNRVVESRVWHLDLTQTQSVI